MDTHEILGYLEVQRDAIDHAIKALNGRLKNRRSKGQRTLSADARKRISQAQRKRWRELKAKEKKA